MEAAGTCEMSEYFYQTMQHYNPEDSHLQEFTYRPKFTSKPL
jgi:hypothetical protein